MDFMKPKTTFSDTIRFTPYAWAKLIYMRDIGATEVAGYCVTATEDPLLITDFCLVKQKCTTGTFDLDAESCVEYVEKMTDDGLAPWQATNILAHTHPGDSPEPSWTDEENFTNAFSHPNWAIMLIVADGGKTYCRLKSNVGPGMEKRLNVCIDWNLPFASSDIPAWNAEYQSNVSEEKFHVSGIEEFRHVGFRGHEAFDMDREFRSIVEDVDIPDVCDEIDNMDCYCDEENDVYWWDEDNGQWYLYEPDTGHWFTENGNEMKRSTPPPNKRITELMPQWADRHATVDSACVPTEEEG